jgi:CheY-like chemotaxis protein
MSRHPLKILAADDDLEDLELVEESLQKLEPSLVVDKVNNGKAIIEYLDDQTDKELPCLIILDYNMPELNGAEVLALISAVDRYKAIPKVVLSTSSALHHMNECIRNGASRYYVKPNTLAGLKELAEAMMVLCRR